MDNEMIDISSISEDFKGNEPTEAPKKSAKKSKNNKKLPKIKIPIIKETGFKSLGNIIKVISFVVAISILAIFVFAAYLLFAFKPLYLIACIAIIVFGIIVSLISLFMIYAIGHIINQNNEIIASISNQEKE